jgi:hypothetical protein
MATTPTFHDKVWDLVSKWGGIAIVVAFIALLVAYILSVAVGLLANTVNTLAGIAGGLGLLIVGMLIGAAIIVGLVKTRRITL